MIQHPRHVVTVYGDKPSYVEYREYYEDIIDMADNLANRRKERIILKPRIDEPGDVIFEIVSGSKRFADELAESLRRLGRYKIVDVDSHVVELNAPEVERYLGEPEMREIVYIIKEMQEERMIKKMREEKGTNEKA